jgi:hypothetical protein
VFTDEDREFALKAISSNDLPASRPPKSIVMHKASEHRRAAE